MGWSDKQDRMNSICAVWIVLVICHCGHSYPGGVPDIACGSMFPSGHSALPQSSSPPFKLILPKKTYSPGETIKVIIKSNGDHYFKGIFLQARGIGCHVNGSECVGVFTANDNQLETRHCFGLVHSSVSHNSNSAKKTKFVYWTAPVHSAGHVIMRATLVEDTSTFWINVVSEILIDLHSRDAPKCIKSTVFPINPGKGVAYSRDKNTNVGNYATPNYVLYSATWFCRWAILELVCAINVWLYI